MSFVDRWNEFWTWTADHAAGAFLFRGQADDSAIIPKIGRKEYGYDAGRELSLFNAFKRAARPFMAVPLQNDWEWLALAQHHGAPTRLVDWSTSPLVAAWFAVTSYPVGTDAFIFALEVDRPDLETLDVVSGLTASGTSIKEPLSFNKRVYLVETPPVSARITTQRGIFTIHGQPTIPLPVPKAHEFKIPAALRADFQGQLLDLGIDASHIFPDIDGLCRTLDWRLKSGKGFSAFN